MAGSADSTRVISPVNGQQGEILSNPPGRGFNFVRWNDGSISLIDKPNICRLVEEKK